MFTPVKVNQHFSVEDKEKISKKRTAGGGDMLLQIMI
jgi:hypothetical protein